MTIRKKAAKPGAKRQPTLTKKGLPRKKTGPKGPRKRLDDKQWDSLIGMIRIQCTAEEIALVFDMSADTLDVCIKERTDEPSQNFSELYKRYMSAGLVSLRRAQFQSATVDRVPSMMIWMGKQLLGQRDFTRQEITGKDGNPLAVTTIDPAKLPDDVLAALLNAREVTESDGGS